MQLTLLQSLSLFKADVNRRLCLEGKPINAFTVAGVIYKRGVVSVLIYRIKRYLYLKDIKLLKVLIWLLRHPEFHYCHNELDPRAEIGAGLVISDFGGLALSYANIIGDNCTFMGKATPTLGAMEGVDIEYDRIRIGDHCVIGHNVKIINAINIASGAQITANAVLLNSINKVGSLVGGFPATTQAIVPLEVVMSWSPLLSQHIMSNEHATN